MDDLQNKLLYAIRDLSVEIKSLKSVMKTQSNKIKKLEEELLRKNDIDEGRSIRTEIMMNGKGLIPEKVFWEAMEIVDPRTKNTWEENGYINRIMIGRRGFIDAASMKASYREDMRRKNFCFEKGIIIRRKTERIRLGRTFGFDPDTGDYIPNSMRDINNPINP
tara:strand:+ start:110 stop:601 length:492 start_codon:yes stop_codon:yes gene_type:complete